MLRTATLLAAAIAAAACSCAAAEELLPLEHAVLFNNNGRVPVE